MNHQPSPIVPIDLSGDSAPENGYDASTVFVGEGAFQRPVNIHGNNTNLHGLARSRIMNFFAIPSEFSAILTDFALHISVAGMVLSGCMTLAALGLATFAMALGAVIGGLFIAAWAQVLDYKGMKPVFLLRLLLIAVAFLAVI